MMIIYMFQSQFLPTRKHNISIIKNTYLMMLKGRMTVILKAYRIP